MLGIKDVDNDVIFIFISYLQSDKVSDLCIDFEYMKNLMQNYIAEQSFASQAEPKNNE